MTGGTYIGASGNTKTMIWRQWTNTSTTATSASIDPTWGYWATDTGTTTATTWTAWTGNATSGCYVDTDATWISWDQTVEKQKLTKAQMKVERKRQADAEVARREQQRLAAIEARNVEVKRKAASTRAEALLLSHLSDEQERAWKENRAIFVTSQSGKRYRIKEGRAHNIHEIGPDGQPIMELCVHVATDVPNADNVLAQKLWLEHNEQEMLRVANKWPMVNGVRR